MPADLGALDDSIRDAARALVDAAGAAGLQPRVTSTLRTQSEQRRLYSRFLAGGSGYPVAPPGQSAHEYGLAFDMVVSPMEALADVGATWISWGGGWSGRDAVHFELAGASDWARQQPIADSVLQQIASDPVGYAAQRASELPWYVGLFAPWQLEIYNMMPGYVRAAFSPVGQADIWSQFVTHLIKHGFSF